MELGCVLFPCSLSLSLFFFPFFFSRVSSYWFFGSSWHVFGEAFLVVLYQCGFFFGARFMRFGSDSCDMHLPVVAPASFSPVVTSCGHVVLPYLVCGQHAP
jgi:hypothetical protein